MTKLSLACLALIASGCGGHSTGGAPSGGGQSGAAASTGGGGGGAAAGGTGALGGGAAGTGGAGMAGSHAGGVPDTADWLMPLRVGTTWDFELTPLDANAAINCGGSGSTARVSGTRPVPTDSGATVEAFVYQTICSATSVAVWGTRDDLSYMTIDPATGALEGPAYQYLVPPVEGASWGGFAWRLEPDVAVPEGVFSDCWRREFTDTPGTYQVYCRGVGPVVMVNDIDGNYRAELGSRALGATPSR